MSGYESAYPQSELAGSAGDYFTVCRGGLTKRELFAAMAMQGQVDKINPSVTVAEWNRITKTLATDSVKLADALLAALEAT